MRVKMIKSAIIGSTGVHTDFSRSIYIHTYKSKHIRSKTTSNKKKNETKLLNFNH